VPRGEKRFNLQAGWRDKKRPNPVRSEFPATCVKPAVSIGGARIRIRRVSQWQGRCRGGIREFGNRAGWLGVEATGESRFDRTRPMTLPG